MDNSHIIKQSSQSDTIFPLAVMEEHNIRSKTFIWIISTHFYSVLILAMHAIGDIFFMGPKVWSQGSVFVRSLALGSNQFIAS